MNNKDKYAELVCHKLEEIIPRVVITTDGDAIRHAQISYDDLKIVLSALNNWEKA